jgi:amino-acid N-acetyltransferase
VRRSRERLETEIDHFVVIERDGMIVGCAALYPLPTDDSHPMPSGEIACVAVHQNYRKGDRGSELLEFLEKRAINKGLKKLFVLTTRTALWFVEHGFEAASVDDLPIERKTLYNFQRNSLVFSKKL